MFLCFLYIFKIFGEIGIYFYIVSGMLLFWVNSEGYVEVVVFINYEINFVVIFMVSYKNLL